MQFNDLYTPSCATDCDDQALAATGNTHCPSANSLELAEINILHLAQKDSATPGSPIAPIASYAVDGDNETAILAWRAAHDNTTANAVRTYVGTGEKPEGSSTDITLHKGIVFSLENRHQLVYTISIIDQATYKALRTLQACKGKFHAWFCTDSYIYGADKGIIVDVEKVVFPKTGGRGDVGKCIITLGWSAKADPIRDPLPYEVV